MKNIFIVLFLFIEIVSFGQIKISELPEAISINNSDIYLTSQGTVSKKVQFVTFKNTIYARLNDSTLSKLFVINHGNSLPSLAYLETGFANRHDTIFFHQKGTWKSIGSTDSTLMASNYSLRLYVKKNDTLYFLDASDTASKVLTPTKGDLRYLKLHATSDNASLLQGVVDSTWIKKHAIETDPKFTTDSSLIKTAARTWNSSVAKKITAVDTVKWNAKMDSLRANSLFAGKKSIASYNSDTLNYTQSKALTIAQLARKQNTVSSIYNVSDWGIYPDNTDYSTQLKTLLDTVSARGGGVIHFNAVKSGYYYYFNKRVIIPCTVELLPKMTPVIIEGVGNTAVATGVETSFAGTIIRIGYTGISKIITKGNGSLEIRNITFKEYTNTGTPFIKTTNTTLYVHNCSFVGYNSAGSANNDVFILGGTRQVVDSSEQSAFQGYGTVIRDNFFNKIRIGATFNSYANAILFTGNTFWNACGGDEAILSNAAGNNNNTGNVIRDNLVEMVNYKYFASLKRATNWTFDGNNMYDCSGVTAYFYLDTGSSFNSFKFGALCSGHTNKVVKYNSGDWRADNEYNSIQQSDTTNDQTTHWWYSPLFNYQNASIKTIDNTGNLMYSQMGYAGTNTISQLYKPSGGNLNKFYSLAYTNDTTYSMDFGSYATTISSLSSLKLKLGTGRQFEVTNPTSTQLFVINNKGDAGFGSVVESYRLRINMNSSSVSGVDVDGATKASSYGYMTGGFTITGTYYPYWSSGSASTGVYTNTSNTSTASTADTRIYLSTTATGGVPYILYDKGGISYSVGIERSTNNFKIAKGSDMTGTGRFHITTSTNKVCFQDTNTYVSTNGSFIAKGNLIAQSGIVYFNDSTANGWRIRKDVDTLKFTKTVTGTPSTKVKFFPNGGVDITGNYTVNGNKLNANQVDTGLTAKSLVNRGQLTAATNEADNLYLRKDTTLIRVFSSPVNSILASVTIKKGLYAASCLDLKPNSQDGQIMRAWIPTCVHYPTMVIGHDGALSMSTYLLISGTIDTVAGKAGYGYFVRPSTEQVMSSIWSDIIYGSCFETRVSPAATRVSRNYTARDKSGNGIFAVEGIKPAIKFGASHPTLVYQDTRNFDVAIERIGNGLLQISDTSMNKRDLTLRNIYPDTVKTSNVETLSNWRSGGYIKTCIDTTVALSGATSVIPVAIPINARISSVQLRNDWSVTSVTGTRYTVAFTGGFIQALTTKSFEKNAKFDTIFVNSPVTTAQADITLTCNNGTFDGGVVRAIVYYEKLAAMSSLTDGLISHWLMNDNASNHTVADAKGAHNGTATVNTSTLTATGKIRSAFAFSGTSQTINCGDILIPQTMTIALWAKTVSYSAVNIIIDKTGGGKYGMSLYLYGKIRGYFGNATGTGYTQFYSHTSLTDNNWHHYAITYSNVSDSIYIYVDGAKDSYVFYNQVIYDDTNNFSISNSSDGCNATLDDLRLYNRVLSPFEIKTLYNSGNGMESE